MSYHRINTEDYVDKFIPYFLYDYDFQVKNGDILTGDTAEQDSYFILIADKGQYRYDIKIGIGIRKYLNGNISKPELKKLIREQLEYDNISVSNIYLLTYEDAIQNGITDRDILKVLKENNFIVQLDIKR